ncbi:MAG: hypothetical protein EOL97_16915 [Spirochaetia bacterium]|nr:hypothetical protein [Spirochaetia bacterium]
MKEYHKIETLFKFNGETKKYTNELYNKNVELLKDNQWLFTEKIDGTNLRIYWDGHKLQYGGRTNNAQFSKDQIEFIEERLTNENIETIFEQKFQDVEVYVFGELFGVKIQNGGLYTNGKGLDFKVFDIEIDGVTLTYDSMTKLANELNYQYVPLVIIGTIDCAINYVLTHYTSTFSNAELEGLVGKPIGDFRDRLGKRIVVKIKRKDLLKMNKEDN